MRLAQTAQFVLSIELGDATPEFDPHAPRPESVSRAHVPGASCT